MADNTPIEWTDATWNVVNGCSVHSPGCTNCYAMKLAGTRLRNHPSREGLTVDTKAGPVWTGEVRFNDKVLLDPLRWRRPRRIFVCAHGDLFHESVPDAWIDRVFAVMALAPQHQFQVLTKRAERMRAYLADRAVVRRICETALKVHRDQPCFDDGPEFSRGNTRRFNVRMKDWWQHVGALTAWTVRGGCAADCWERAEPNTDYPSRLAWPLPNVWLGVSVEDQARADERIPHLLATPAAVRWLSCEPLLGPVDLTEVPGPFGGRAWLCTCDGFSFGHASDCRLAIENDLHWIVAGGESGPGARPMHPDWARALRDQCAAAGVPFLFKQWGEWAPSCSPDRDGPTDFVMPDRLTIPITSGMIWPTSGVPMRRVGKKRAGRLLDGVQHDGFPA